MLPQDLRQGVTDVTRRPVIFAFNGGTGASSSPLHLNALGPRRYAIDEGALVHLMERKKRGLDVRVVMPRDGRIHLADLLAAARVDARVAPYWIRIAPSVSNDMADIERLLEALS